MVPLTDVHEHVYIHCYPMRSLKRQQCLCVFLEINSNTDNITEILNFHNFLFFFFLYCITWCWIYAVVAYSSKWCFKNPVHHLGLSAGNTRCCSLQEIIYSGLWRTQFHQNILDPSMAQPIISQKQTDCFSTLKGFRYPNSCIVHLYSHQMKDLPLMIFLEHDKCFLQSWLNYISS